MNEPSTPPQAPASMPQHPVVPPPTAPSGGAPKKRRHEGLRSALSTVAVLLLAPLIALFLITFVFQSYLVDGPSMETTLFNNDRLIVWKLPRSWARLTHHTYIPDRGDIVVFTDPKIALFGQDANKQLIKRVIGLPGERVVVRDNVVTIYNKDNPNGFNPDFTLPYKRLAKDTAGDIDLVVPQGDVYLMGDHRTNSLDSRSFGPVPAKYIIGKLALRLLPINTLKRF